VKIRKIASLAGILARNPREFAERVNAIAQGRMQSLRHQPASYATISADELAVLLDGVLDGGFSRALAEPALGHVETEVRERLERVRGGPINDLHNGDEQLARCCYALTRITRPRVIIETGVAHGVSSAFFLAALAENGGGELHSIDLPPLDAGVEDRVGAAVPERLRTRWTLHRGISRRLLPEVLECTGGCDIFMHDSLHTYENMTFELGAVPDAHVIISDDVELNSAFAECCMQRGGTSAVVREVHKPSLFGVLLR
jgi:hypothetical protein